MRTRHREVSPAGEAAAASWEVRLCNEKCPVEGRDGQIVTHMSIGDEGEP